MRRFFTIFVLLSFIGTAQGARFTYYGGGYRAFYYVYVQDAMYYEGPLSETRDSISYTGFINGYVDVSYARSYAGGYVWSQTSNNSVCIKSYSSADGAADNMLAYTSGWGYGRTQNPETYGIFYKITPDTGEVLGDDVKVYYNDIVNISATGTTYACIGGPGSMNYIAITRGQLPPVQTEPDREKVVLRFPNVELSNGDIYLFSGVHCFAAKIGDVIGVFAENYTEVEGWGYISGLAQGWHTMILSVKSVLVGDLDHDNDVDFYDLAKLANNWLVDIGEEPPIDVLPPSPDPMQWAEGGEPKEIKCGSGDFDYCATMTAETATDPSGGIQYYFSCTTRSGFSSGWQSNPTYTVLVGRSGQAHRFRVKARDLYNNETGWSSELPALP